MLLHVNIDNENIEHLKEHFLEVSQKEEFEKKLQEVAEKELYDVTSQAEKNLAYKMFMQIKNWKKSQCEYDIIKNICERIWEMSEEHICEKCGKALMGKNPQSDWKGNFFCNQCAQEKLDYCDFCDNRYEKQELKYYPNGQCFCKHCLEILRK